jgi:hypothetical protein
MSAVEALRSTDAEIEQLELAMLATASTDEMVRLQGLRAELVKHRALAERRLAAEREQRRRLPPMCDERLWREWEGVRFLHRSQLSAKSKAYIIERFGLSTTKDYQSKAKSWTSMQCRDYYSGSKSWKKPKKNGLGSK